LKRKGGSLTLPTGGVSSRHTTAWSISKQSFRRLPQRFSTATTALCN